MRVRYQAAPHPELAIKTTGIKIVGVAGFEPTLEYPYFIGITLSNFHFLSDFGYY
jgi:hypothetical protein